MLEEQILAVSLEEENSPRTLLEIGYEVGYPFQAQAQLPLALSDKYKVVPVGQIITVFSVVKKVGETHPVYHQYCASSNSVGRGWYSDGTNTIAMNIPRWILVKKEVKG